MPLPQRRTPLTHFLCIPLLTTASRPQLQASMNRFRGDFCQQIETSDLSDAASIAKEVIRPLGTLHLTLGVMSLNGDEGERQAVQLLQDLDMDILIKGHASSGLENRDPRSDTKRNSALTSTSEESSLAISNPIRVKLEGLKAMHTPTRTSILYASPTDPDNRIQALCESIKSAL